jgi:hypothetical protein
MTHGQIQIIANKAKVSRHTVRKQNNNNNHNHDTRRNDSRNTGTQGKKTDRITH